MMDFDKAEFLHKLDVRFAAFSSLLEMHEKYIISLCESNKVFKDATKAVERHHREIYEFITETDKKINEFFEKVKSETNTPPADVVEVVRCKDCKHCVLTDEGECNPEDIVCDYFMTDGMQANDYCSYGERRADDE